MKLTLLQVYGDSDMIFVDRQIKVGLIYTWDFTNKVHYLHDKQGNEVLKLSADVVKFQRYKRNADDSFSLV